ncbi:MAG: hypothetical protein GF346_01450 [Candidatus Eisenbacteria bacterium]|nr:hypothetical protein [Candidatus Latescibacterota bacterium]MBD3301095.1 hypothetical protein [Candidatus Eisenbacteria bacterium]
MLDTVRRTGEDWRERAARRLRARGFRPSLALRVSGASGRFGPGVEDGFEDEDE